MSRPLQRLSLIWVASSLAVCACRYSVRDTGFVELNADPYRLELTAPPDFDSNARIYRELAASLLLEANLTFSFRTNATVGPGNLRLVDSQGRFLDLTGMAGLPTERSGVRQLLESVVSSPRREDIHRESLRAYAVVVLVEGTRESENQRVRQVVQLARSHLARLLPSMPKPVEVPPELIPVTVAEQRAEAVLLWGLGLDPQPTAEPRVAVVYGRGRSLGTPLEGPVITRTVLQERLALIGQDCECDLDRAWLKGPILPGRWDRELQQIAARTLGFDPENPLVRTEVSRIVLRGEGERTRKKTPTSALALGYTEEAVDSVEADAPAVAAAEDGDGTPPTTVPETAPSQPPPAMTGPKEFPSAGPLWVGLTGAFGLSIGLGLWLVRRAGKL